jgi:trigger factor
LAGKKAVFDVSVAEVSKRLLPELTDDFANNVRAGLTVDSLKEELRKAVDSEDAKEFTPARNTAIAKALAEVLEVDVPDTLVTKQARDKFANMMADMRNSGVSDEEIKKQIVPENFLKYKNIVKVDIVKDFKVSMAVDEIARLEGIDIPESQVEEQMESLKAEAQKAGEDFEEGQVRSRVELALQRESVMDFLAEKSNLDVEFTDGDEFDEDLMQRLADEAVAREAAETVESDQGESTPVAALAEPVVEAEVEEPAEEPVVEAAKGAPLERDYESMTLEDKAYYALLDAGALDAKED